MTLIQNRYPIDYRAEIVRPLMAAVHRGESVCLVGLAGAGKSNLVHFLEQPEVKRHYLPEDVAARTHFVSLSCRPGSQPKDQVFGALLTGVWLVAGRLGYDLTRVAPVGAAPYQTLRNVLQDFCGVHDQHLVFLLDEFEGLIRQQPEDFFDDLRALRDDHRAAGRLAFVTITHRMPQLVSGLTAFGRTKFFALLRQSIYPLQPYRSRDAEDMLDGLLRRGEGAEVTLAHRQRLIAISGGHSGLLKAIFTATTSEPEMSVPRLLQLGASSEEVRDICEQIWTHLHRDEQQALRLLARNQEISPQLTSYLQRRGLLRHGPSPGIFSPLFGAYIVKHQLDV